MDIKETSEVKSFEDLKGPDFFNVMYDEIKKVENGVDLMTTLGIITRAELNDQTKIEDNLPLYDLITNYGVRIAKKEVSSGDPRLNALAPATLNVTLEASRRIHNFMTNHPDYTRTSNTPEPQT